MILFIIVANVLVLMLIAIAAVGVVRRRRDKRAPVDQSAQPDGDGVIVVPIVAAMLHGGGGMFGGTAKNSINPRLALTPQGLAFKVLRQERLAYGELTRVHAAKGLMGPTLDFNAGRASLHVTVRDLATARKVLAALPLTVPLNPKAKALRDDGTV